MRLYHHVLDPCQRLYDWLQFLVQKLLDLPNVR